MQRGQLVNSQLKRSVKWLNECGDNDWWLVLIVNMIVMMMITIIMVLIEMMKSTLKTYSLTEIKTYTNNVSRLSWYGRDRNIGPVISGP